MAYTDNKIRSRIENSILATVAAFLMVVGHGAQSRAASSPTKVIIAHATINPRVAPLWVAKGEGFFTKYGVEAEVVNVKGASVLAAALTSGDVQIGLIGASSVLNAVAGGIDLQLLGSLSNRSIFGLAVRPGIKGREDLRGGRFGVSSIGGIIWLRTMLALEKLGLDQQKDNIRILIIGDAPVLSRALEVGTIDAVTFEPFFLSRLKEKGFPILYNFDLPMASIALVARRAYIQAHFETLENTVKAVVESIAFVLAPRNKPVVLNTIMKHLRISDPAIAEDGYQELLKGVDRKPYASIEGLRNIQKAMSIYNPTVSNLKLEDLIETRFIRKLDESGFIDRLYKSYGGQ